MSSLWFWEEITQARQAMEWTDEVAWMGTPDYGFWEPMDLLGIFKSVFGIKLNEG